MTAAARHLTHIRLELARSPGFPDGSARHGYEFVAPLDTAGHLDGAGWKATRERCRVRRFWGDAKDDVGHLVHRGSGWFFHYDVAGAEDDEAGFRLAQHSFNLGDYVSIRDDDGHLHTFRVVAADGVPV